MAGCMTLSEPRSSASFFTLIKPRMDPVFCCQGFEKLLVWWPLDRQIILHFAEGYSDRNAKCRRLDGYLLLLLLIHLLSMLCRLRLLSVSLLSFGALLGTCKKQTPISVNWEEMNTIHMHWIERAVVQKIGWLPFAVAPHLLVFDPLPPLPAFCSPPLVWCAPGDMQKTKSDLRQSERNEHDTYAQNRESGTAEICMPTSCGCSSSTCF